MILSLRPGEILTQPRGFFQVAKARPEEIDRRTAKDVVENGEKLGALLRRLGTPLKNPHIPGSSDSVSYWLP